MVVTFSIVCWHGIYTHCVNSKYAVYLKQRGKFKNEYKGKNNKLNKQ